MLGRMVERTFVTVNSGVTVYTSSISITYEHTMELYEYRMEFFI